MRTRAIANARTTQNKPLRTADLRRDLKQWLDIVNSESATITALKTTSSAASPAASASQSLVPDMRRYSILLHSPASFTVFFCSVSFYFVLFRSILFFFVLFRSFSFRLVVFYYYDFILSSTFSRVNNLAPPPAVLLIT